MRISKIGEFGCQGPAVRQNIKEEDQPEALLLADEASARASRDSRCPGNDSSQTLHVRNRTTFRSGPKSMTLIVFANKYFK